MQCQKCGMISDLKFCPKCHSLMGQKIEPRDEARDMQKDGIGAYFGESAHPIIMRPWNLPVAAFGPFYSSYYGLYKTTLIGMLIDLSFVFLGMQGPIQLLVFGLLRLFVYFVFGNMMMLAEVKEKVKKILRRGKSVEYIATMKMKKSIVYPTLVFFVYAMIILFAITVTR